jgi:2-dehydro-3-deoxyphosphooctonate aldolase (KDO 8-P synthase)
MKFFIGPCVLEDEVLVDEIASFLKEKLPVGAELIFKGSFDKANRTSIDSFRGPGLEKGLIILENIGRKYQLPTVTDFHLPEQAEAIASVVDYLQVPAFLCRQTDMILAGAQACARYNKNLKIKKAQFLGPWDMANVVKKAQSKIPVERIFLTERGSCYGYNNLIVDMASFQIMKETGASVIHDATHCVQKPGGLGDKTGGKREQIVTLARAAVAAGAQGIFLETHPRPDQAKSDASTSLDLKKVPKIVGELIKLKNTIVELDANE